MALENLHDYLRDTGRHLLISGSNRDVTRVLKNSGLLTHIGEENIFPATANPTAATRQALQRAKQLLPHQEPELRLFYEHAKLPPEASRGA
jgi:SulP family sulfate permease